MKLAKLLFVFVVMILAISACGVHTTTPDTMPEPGSLDIIETAAADGRFTHLLAALKAGNDPQKAVTSGE